MQQNDAVFRSMPVPRAVANLAVPTVMSMLVTVIYNMADTYFVGQTGDANQVAAVSLTMPVFMLLMAMGNMFGVGGSSMISRTLGAGDSDKVKHISSFCFYGAIFVGLLMVAVFFLGMPTLLQLIGVSENTRQYTQDYLVWIAAGAPFVILANSFSNVLRGEGSARQAMIGMMIGTVANIVLDPIMILGMNMGVEGAAIATIIGNILSAAYYVQFILRKSKYLSIRPRDFRLSERIPTGVLSVGLPSSVNNILLSTANIILNNFLVAYGDAPVAAMGVAMKANMLVVMLQLGLAMGVQPLIGYNYGAKNYPRMRSVIRFAMLCTLVIGGVLTAVYYFSADVIIRVFISDETVIGYGVAMLRALMISGPFLGILFVFINVFQALGRVIPSLALSLSRQGLLFLPILVLLSTLFGLDGIIVAQPIADTASIFIAAGMYFYINRKLKKLEQAAGAPVEPLKLAEDSAC